MSIPEAAISVLAHLREHGMIRLDDPPALRLKIALLEDEVRMLSAALKASGRADPPPAPAPVAPTLPPMEVPPPPVRKPKEGLPFRVRSATEPYECSMCGIEKPATEYPRQTAVTHEHRRNGTVCEVCASKRAKESYATKAAQKPAAELLALPSTTEAYPAATFRCQGCLSTAFTESLRQPGICVQCVEKMRSQGPVLNGAASS